MERTTGSAEVSPHLRVPLAPLHGAVRDAPRIDGVALSLCMIAKDEATVLPNALRSVAGVAEEVIVVDTGSQDDTVGVAVAHGARVVRHRWQDDFSAARNVALAEATGDWILVLDADEALAAGEGVRIRTLITTASCAGARVRIRNLQAPGELFRHFDARVTRLFRNCPRHRYEGVVHEQITPAILRAGGRVEDVDVTILHYGYTQRTAQRGADRAARNRMLLETALLRAPDDPYLSFQLGVTYKSLGRGAEARTALRRALACGEEALGLDVATLAHQKLAQLALAENEFDQAVLHARASLMGAPEDLLSLHMLGLATLFQGRAAEAYPIFARLRGLAEGQIADLAKLDAVLAHCRTLAEVAGNEVAPR